MAETAKDGQPELQEVHGVWADEADTAEPVFADQMRLHRINDQFYLTFGRIDVPVVEGRAAIKPLSRFIVPLDAMQKIRDLLNRVLREE